MEVWDVLTQKQMKRLKRNNAIREEFNELMGRGFKRPESIRKIAEKYELSEIMVRQIIRKKTAL